MLPRIANRAKPRIMTHTIRPATPDDIPLIAQLIRDLAEYEKLSHEVRFDEVALKQHLFGPHPLAEVVIGQIDGAPQGFALFFHNFSTFEGRPGIYLEDLYVRPAARGSERVSRILELYTTDIRKICD